MINVFDCCFCIFVEYLYDFVYVKWNHLIKCHITVRHNIDWYMYYSLGVPNYLGICGGASRGCSCSAVGGNGPLGSSCYYSVNKVSCFVEYCLIWYFIKYVLACFFFHLHDTFYIIFMKYYLLEITYHLWQPYKYCRCIGRFFLVLKYKTSLVSSPPIKPLDRRAAIQTRQQMYNNQGSTPGNIYLQIIIYTFFRLLCFRFSLAYSIEVNRSMFLLCPLKWRII